MDITIIVAIVGVVGVIVGGMISSIFQWIISRSLNNSAVRKANADTASLYQQIANTAANEAVKTEQRIAALENAVDIKDRRITELETANNSKDLQIAALQREVNELRTKFAVLEERKQAASERIHNDRAGDCGEVATI